MRLFIHRLARLCEILLAMSGVVVRRTTFARGASILLSLMLYFWMTSVGSITIAIGYFAVATLIHYIVLFGMFMPQGWSRLFIAKYGEEDGFRRYEALMALVFFHNGASTALACTVSAGTLFSIAPEYVWMIAGLMLSCIGLPTKIWATHIVGIDTYYYRDLFLRRPLGEFRVAGPYKIFRNPMYGVGHLHGYGSALLVGSLMGLVMVALNQACVWFFYWTIERPFVAEMYKTNESTMIHDPTKDPL